jgi:hypothetical protein
LPYPLPRNRHYICLSVNLSHCLLLRAVRPEQPNRPFSFREVLRISVYFSRRLAWYRYILVRCLPVLILGILDSGVIYLLFHSLRHSVIPWGARCLYFTGCSSVSFLCGLTAISSPSLSLLVPSSSLVGC